MWRWLVTLVTLVNSDARGCRAIHRALSLHILFVDMDRAKSSWPYRWLTPHSTGGVGDRRRFIILKRERRQHFVALASVHGASCFTRSELPDVVRVLWDVP